MTPKQASSITPRERLRRLAEVFAVELRLRIVTASYKRPMSPKLFFEQFGGGSRSRVNRNFERLAASGWLRRVFSKGPGGPRRGGVERFYRSVELPYFDDASWALVPHSMRVACSWSLFQRIAKRLRQSLEMAPENPRWGRDLDCLELTLDRDGWHRVVAAANALFVAIFEAQEDAQTRAAESRGSLLQMDVLLAVFESPRPPRQAVVPLPENKTEPLTPFLERLAPVFADDFCLQLVSEANHRALSVTQFRREFAARVSYGGIRSRFERLETAGWLRRVGSETGGRRRGAREHFYRATRPALLVDDEAWCEPPKSVRARRTWPTFCRFCDQVLESLRSDVFDARLDRVVTLSFLEVDEEGAAEVVSRLEAFAHVLEQERDRAAIPGHAPSAADAVGVTVASAAFETPPELAKEP